MTRDLALLGGHGITHVVNCAEEEACRFRNRFRYLHLKMKDPADRFGGFDRWCV
jgi:hypothetical protein